MARKEIIFDKASGRDAGKKFLITEMSARAGHSWATRALLAIMSAGVDIPDAVMNSGMAGLASVMLNAVGKLQPHLAAPLLDELLDCVQVVFPTATRKWIDDDFEEIQTIFMLQKVTFSLHIEPFISGGGLTPVSQKATPTAD